MRKPRNTPRQKSTDGITKAVSVNFTKTAKKSTVILISHANKNNHVISERINQEIFQLVRTKQNNHIDVMYYDLSGDADVRGGQLFFGDITNDYLNMSALRHKLFYDIAKQYRIGLRAMNWRYIVLINATVNNIIETLIQNSLIENSIGFDTVSIKPWSAGIKAMKKDEEDDE